MASAAQLIAKTYPETAAGGFTRWDATVHFFTRVNALLAPDMRVIDVGAGRGALHGQVHGYVRELICLKGKVRQVVGVDLDPVVSTNPGLDVALIGDGARMPFADGSIDMAVSDQVFEHIADPESLARELARVVRPGGWICARTPHLYSALVLASRLIPNRLHARALRTIQPEREAEDVFPAYYRLNSFRKLRKLFPSDQWRNCSYTWSSEPRYHGGSFPLFHLQRLYQWGKQPLLGGEILMVFMQKRECGSPRADAG